MSHLQKAFIAKNKGRMRHQPKRLTHGQVQRQANKVIERIGPVFLGQPTSYEVIFPPNHLVFTLKR